VVEVDGHIGHGAVLHGCRIGRNAMVGMNAVVMDKAVVGEESIVAAELREGRHGHPAAQPGDGHAGEGDARADGRGHRVEEFRHRQYHDLAVRSMKTMREVEALTEVEPDRPRIDFGPARLKNSTPPPSRETAVACSREREPKACANNIRRRRQNMAHVSTLQSLIAGRWLGQRSPPRRCTAR
jgi:hypothetical protein